MAVENRARRLQKAIIISSALGIFTVAVIVAAACIVPLYTYLKTEEKRSLSLALSAKSIAVEEFLARAKDVGLQIAADLTTRERLLEYNEGKIGRLELIAATQPSLLDAMSHAQEVWGVTRLDEKGHVVVQAGLDIPQEFLNLPDPVSSEASFSGPITLGRYLYLVVQAPILDSQARLLGADIILFRLFKLERIVEDYTGLGKTGETILGVVDGDQVKIFFPFRENGFRISKTLSVDSSLGSALVKASNKRTGIQLPEKDGDGNDVIAYGPIRGSNWGIALRIDQDELYAPVKSQILATVHIIVGLILLGTLGMVLLVRPLAGKIIIHTDELQREIAEKTASLQRELNERRRVDKWLRDSERRYRMLVENVPDVIFILDNEGRFTYINVQVERFLDCHVRDILETQLAEHIVPEDLTRIQRMFELNVDSIWDEEVGILDIHGKRKQARIRCKPTYSEENGLRRYEGVMRDITRRKQLEDELKASREELLEKIKIIDELYEHIVQSGKSKAIGDHTAEVAHELRQPLAIIGGFARRMVRQIDACDPAHVQDHREACNIIISEVHRLEKILDKLIEFTRHERVHPEKIDPNELIERVLEVHEDRMKEKGLRLETSLGSEVGEISVDSLRFEQVVRNLVSNAVEASLPNEVIRVETGASIPSGKAQETGGLEAETYFEMKIRNHGRIIPPDELSKIFSPFYTTKDYGTGIGLTLSKNIIEDHHGSISVKSDREGTVFTVWLPVHQLGKPLSNL